MGKIFMYKLLLGFFYDKDIFKLEIMIRSEGDIMFLMLCIRID